MSRRTTHIAAFFRRAAAPPGLPRDAQDIDRIEDPRWPDRLVPNEVVIEGAWGVSTEDDGGPRTITVPGRSARAGTSPRNKDPQK